MDYILGLDLGETSLGWAVIKVVDGQPAGLIDAGSRVFPPIVDRSANLSNPKIKNADRRMHRGARRVLARRVSRRESLQSALSDAGLLPESEKERAQLFAAVNPYEARAKALDEKLPPHELGRALYHLAQHRGFKSNRKEESSDDKEQGKVAKEIGTLQALITEAACRTLGEFLWRLGRDSRRLEYGETRLRNRRFSRDMVEAEFDAVWQAQQAHHPALLTEKLRARLHNNIFFQRDFAISDERRAALPKRANALRAPQLKACSLIPDEKRCGAGEWIAQQFRIWKEVNNLRVMEGHHAERPLTVEEAAKLVAGLIRQKKMTFGRMKTILGFAKDSHFNLEAGGRKDLDGNTVEAALATAFGKAWDALDEETKHERRSLLTHEESPEKLAEVARQWGLDDEAAEKLAKFKPKGSYLRYSAKAMEILLPYVEAGLMEYDAIVQATEDGKLPHSEETDPVDRLPGPPDLPNPNVMRCLHETRKVVNALLAMYGKPMRIVVELARDLKASGAEREAAVRRMRDNEKLNRQAREFFADHGNPEPSNTDLIRYRLWQEQECECPYSGRTITADHLLSHYNVLEIDHILPYSLSLDDSLQNKVLCFTDANRDKGQRTPFQWKGGPDSEAYEEMITRVRRYYHYNRGKLLKFQRAEIDVEEVIQQKLVDTRYASREVKTFLALLYPPAERVGEKRVQASPGRVTAILRYLWGLNTILNPEGDNEKSRLDHRHHTVDAVVIACTERRFVKALSDAAKRELRRDEMHVPPPWEGFRGEVERVLCRQVRTWNVDGREITTEGILVSHRAERKIGGALHEETSYGPTADPKVFTSRVKVENLTGAMVARIRDKTIRRIVREHLLAQDIDPAKKTGVTPAKAWQTMPQLPVSAARRRKDPTLPESIPIRKVRVLKTIDRPLLMPGPDGEPYRAVITGSNHHMEIVEEIDAKGRRKWVGIPVTMLEAARRARRANEPIIQRDHGEKRKFVMSLCKGEAVFVETNGEFNPYRVQKMDQQGRVWFRRLTDAGPVEQKKLLQKNVGALSGKIFKIALDAVGRVKSCHD
ncbi:MAG: type II CRISPR RNA-guided endonuclease Cas9 [Candidatus Lernaella stagnicola]|nr:type II CRISPR RNA-guided endonuclease Cas9 [Candidatus Lernaella stagnicola]